MKKKVLAIDDDKTVLRLADRLLSTNGFEVLKADGGQESLRLGVYR